MPYQLLDLALTVERHHTDAYHWVVVELRTDEQEYLRLLESSQIFSSYAAALSAGCAALTAFLLPESADSASI